MADRCGPPAGIRPEDVTTWERCGECDNCRVEARILSGEIRLVKRSMEQD